MQRERRTEKGFKDFRWPVDKAFRWSIPGKKSFYFKNTNDQVKEPKKKKPIWKNYPSKSNERIIRRSMQLNEEQADYDDSPLYIKSKLNHSLKTIKIKYLIAFF